jgi:hypothetical protein
MLIMCKTLLGLMVLVLFLSVNAQPYFNAICEGTVKDAAGNGVKGIMFNMWARVSSNTPEIVATDSTNDNGFYYYEFKQILGPFWAAPIDTDHYVFMETKDSTWNDSTTQILGGILIDYTILPKATNVNFNSIKIADNKNAGVNFYDILGRRLTIFKPKTDGMRLSVISGLNGKYRLIIIH